MQRAPKRGVNVWDSGAALYATWLRSSRVFPTAQVAVVLCPDLSLSDMDNMTDNAQKKRSSPEQGEW